MSKYEDVVIADQDTFIADFKEQMETFGLPINDQQCKDFYSYYVALIEANRYMNLTGIVDMHEVIIKHFIDSLSAYDPKYIQDGASLIDVGTGAGFPGLPLPHHTRHFRTGRLCRVLPLSAEKSRVAVRFQVQPIRPKFYRTLPV